MIRMEKNIFSEMMQVLEQFCLSNKVVSVSQNTQGHINDTYFIFVEKQGTVVLEYVLQKVNRKVFPDVEALMDNVARVTTFLQNQPMKEEDGRWETLTLIPTKSGAYYYVDADGECWRVYAYVKNTNSYNTFQKPGLLYEAALAFGKFVKLLDGFPAQTLHETIPSFHDTEARLLQLKSAADADIMGRRQEVGAELEFVRAREADIPFFNNMLRRGELPVRVTHNDTKLNNVLFDAETDKGVCVIDLDTVMPGLLAYDFGDAIRFGANTAAEDEPDLDKCRIDLERFEEYVKGFFCHGAGAITKNEIDTLPMAAKMMTLECGMRFLTDYLAGDTYFKIDRPRHNLDRARNQFKLVADMENNWDSMHKIVEKVTKGR